MPAALPQTDARPLYEIIYGVLREHLLEGSFPTGLVLGEAGVARAFKSSRIPAAAALQRLSDEGLIKRLAEGAIWPRTPILARSSAESSPTPACVCRRRCRAA